MIQQEDHMTISELAVKTDVPISTIKFYIREKLLPNPLKTAQTRGLYNSQHLNRLNLIQKIKKEGKMSIGQIKDIVKMIDKENEIIENQNHSKNPLQQKTEIIETSINIFREKGYDTASITDIIKEVGIGRSSFYKHFENKKAIFMECIQALMEREALSLDLTGTEEEKNILSVFNQRAEEIAIASPIWKDMVNILKAAAISNPEEFSDKLEEVIQSKIEIYQKRIKKGIEQGILRNVNHEIVAVMVLGIQEYCSNYLLDKISKQELIEVVTDVLLHGTLKKAT